VCLTWYEGLEGQNDGCLVIRGKKEVSCSCLLSLVCCFGRIMPIRLEEDKVRKFPKRRLVQCTLTPGEWRKLKERPWTKEDLETLQKYWYSLGPVLLAGELKRSIEGVEKMGKKLGLKDMEAMVDKEIAKLDERWRKLKL